MLAELAQMGASQSLTQHEPLIIGTAQWLSAGRLTSARLT